MSRDQRPPAGPPLLRLIDLARRALAEELDRRIIAAGFSDHRYAYHNIFAYLWEDEGTRITTLADRAAITKQSMSELVREAAARNYVELVPDPEDGRAKLVRFGPRGRQTLPIVMEAFAETEAELARRYGARKVAELRRILSEIATSTPSAAP